jgi:dTDP-4-amino-4,6-dideoxygalactose transaminase
MPAALARAQLKRLDEYNDWRIANCTYLSERLKTIEGVHPPHVPENRKPVYWMYTVEFYPEEVGIDAEPGHFRSAVEKALFREGVQVGQWQTMPVPAQDLFQTKKGHSASGYPWNFSEEGKKLEYRVEEYPHALDYCKRYTVVAGIHPPNSRGLMEKYADAFEKVFSQLDRVMDHADDDVIAHYTGEIFRAG